MKDKINKHTRKQIFDALNDPGLPEDTLRLIRGWLVDNRYKQEKEKLLLQLFHEKFDFSSKPSKAAYEALPEMLERIGYPKKPVYKKPLKYRAAFRFAAILIPLLILTGAAVILRKDSMGRQEMATVHYAAVEAPDSTTRRVVLPCGTRIDLNRGSRIEYAEETFDRQRTVYLTGEAWFEVTPTGIPFLIETQGLLVRVLGTTFNVRSAQEDTVTEVSLYSGMVEVITPQNKPQILHPNEQLEYDRETGSSRIVEFDAEIVNQWRTTIDITDVTLERAFRIIGDYFGVTILSDENTPGNRTVRGRFYDESLPEVLEMLGHVTGAFDHRIDQDTVFIYGRSNL